MSKENTKIKGGYCRFRINGTNKEEFDIPEQIISQGVAIYPNPKEIYNLHF